MMLRRLLVSLALTATLALSGCATRFYTPDSVDSKLMLSGNDPVSYQTGATPVKGDPALKVEWDGGIYRFANAANRDLFNQNPAKYAPQYGGSCSNGAPFSILLGGSTDTYKVVDGRLFMFSGPDSRKYWEMNEKRNLELGDKYWESEMKSIWSATLHSYYRIAFKVPHYMTGKEQREEWERRQDKK
jgi:YHS domain-containing protein